MLNSEKRFFREFCRNPTYGRRLNILKPRKHRAKGTRKLDRGHRGPHENIQKKGKPKPALNQLLTIRSYWIGAYLAGTGLSSFYPNCQNDPPPESAMIFT